MSRAGVRRLVIGVPGWGPRLRSRQQAAVVIDLPTPKVPSRKQRGARGRDLPSVMSKFPLLGRSLDQVIACVTINAARVFEVFNDPGKRHQTVVWRMSWAQQPLMDRSVAAGAQKRTSARVVLE